MLTRAAQYGGLVRELSAVAFQYQVKLPRVSTNSFINIASDSGKIERYPPFQSKVTALTKTESPDCKEASLIVAACAVNEFSRSMKPGETTEIELVSGLYFGEGKSANGYGHMWVLGSPKRNPRSRSFALDREEQTVQQ